MQTDTNCSLGCVIVNYSCVVQWLAIGENYVKKYSWAGSTPYVFSNHSSTEDRFARSHQTMHLDNSSFISPPGAAPGTHRIEQQYNQHPMHLAQFSHLFPPTKYGFNRLTGVDNMLKSCGFCKKIIGITHETPRYFDQHEHPGEGGAFCLS